MKFPTKKRIEEVKADQTVARKCYNTTLRDPTSKETLSVGVKLYTTMNFFLFFFFCTTFIFGFYGFKKLKKKIKEKRMSKLKLLSKMG